MADITLTQMQAYADASGLTGAVNASDASIDLSALTGDSMNGSSGLVEALIKLLKLARDTAVAEQVGLDNYGAAVTRVAAATDNLPEGVQISYTINGRTAFSYDDLGPVS